MGILTTTDALYFAPSLSTLTSDQLGAMINYVNFLVESPQGANRPLAIQRWTEKLKLVIKLQNCYVSYRPIILDDPINYPISAKIRIANTLNYFGRGVPTQIWTDIDLYHFIIDIDGQFNLGYGLTYLYDFPNFNQFIRPVANEIQVSYYSGLVIGQYNPYMSNQLSQEVMNLKVAAGEICRYMASKLYQGVSSLQVPFDEFTVQFRQSGNPFQIPDYLLYPFRNYKPTLKY